MTGARRSRGQSAAPPAWLSPHGATCALVTAQAPLLSQEHYTLTVRPPECVTCGGPLEVRELAQLTRQDLRGDAAYWRREREWRLASPPELALSLLARDFTLPLADGEAGPRSYCCAAHARADCDLCIDLMQRAAWPPYLGGGRCPHTNERYTRLCPSAWHLSRFTAGTWPNPSDDRPLEEIARARILEEETEARVWERHPPMTDSIP